MKSLLAELDRRYRSRYDAEAPTYDRTRFGDRRGRIARRVKDRAIVELLGDAGVLRPGARILDAATGTGRILQALRKAPVDRFGVDLSRGMLREAARESFRLTQADLKCLAFRAASFDAAVLGGFLYLVPAAAYAAFTHDLARVLKPGAPLIVEIANTRTAFNPRNYRRIARHVRESAIKSYIPPSRLGECFPAFDCDAVVGAEYPVLFGERGARWIGRMPLLRTLGGKYIARLRRRGDGDPR